MNAHTSVSITDIKGTIIYADTTFCTVNGYSQNELIGANQHTKGFWREMFLVVSKGGVWNDEILNVAKDGTRYWGSTAIFPQYEHGKLSGYITILTDITQYKKLQSKLERMAQYDDLTRLPNRSLNGRPLKLGHAPMTTP